MTDQLTCCLCGQEFSGYGNNPEPIKTYPERCCNACNTSLVIPWRIRFGRNTEPLWLSSGSGKSAWVDHVICTHPFHDRVFVNEMGLEYSEDWSKGNVWYGKPALDNDPIGQAVEGAIGKTKSSYGLITAK